MSGENYGCRHDGVNVRADWVGYTWVLITPADFNQVDTEPNVRQLFGAYPYELYL